MFILIILRKTADILVSKHKCFLEVDNREHRVHDYQGKKNTNVFKSTK